MGYCPDRVRWTIYGSVDASIGPDAGDTVLVACEDVTSGIIGIAFVLGAVVVEMNARSVDSRAAGSGRRKERYMSRVWLLIYLTLLSHIHKAVVEVAIFRREC